MRFFRQPIIFPGAVTWKNKLFENVSFNLDPTVYWINQTVNCDLRVVARNNLFKDVAWLTLYGNPAGAGNWVLRDNLFDKVNFYQSATAPLDYDHNGYWPLTAAEQMANGSDPQLLPTAGNGSTNGLNEVMLSSAPAYQVGHYGNYYLPMANPLYGAGSQPPGGSGLYHYTTRVNGVKEGEEVSGHDVNIGLHYVATASFHRQGGQGHGWRRHPRLFGELAWRRQLRRPRGHRNRLASDRKQRSIFSWFDQWYDCKWINKFAG